MKARTISRLLGTTGLVSLLAGLVLLPGAIIFEPTEIGAITIAMWICAAMAMLLATLALITASIFRDRIAVFRGLAVLVIIAPFLWVGIAGALDRKAEELKAAKLKTRTAQQDGDAKR